MSDWPPIDQAFEEFWSIAVRKVGKADARKAVIKVWKRGAPWANFFSAWRRHNEEMKGKELKFVPHPATFVNREEFSDDPPRIFTPSDVPTAQPKMVHVKIDTEQWRAWCKYLGKTPPQDRNFGWHFQSEWPPNSSGA